jgi:hypothetical protein
LLPLNRIESNRMEWNYVYVCLLTRAAPSRIPSGPRALPPPVCPVRWAKRAAPEEKVAKRPRRLGEERRRRRRCRSRQRRSPGERSSRPSVCPAPVRAERVLCLREESRAGAPPPGPARFIGGVVGRLPRDGRPRGRVARTDGRTTGTACVRPRLTEL